MIITRKIQVFVNEDDKDKRKELIDIIYDWRYHVRKAANIIVAHHFTQERINEFYYLTDEAKEKFDILKKEKGNSPQNTTYRILSSLLKGKVNSDIYSCLNQMVYNSYKKINSKEINKGQAVLQTFKNNIPIPFSGKSIIGLRFEDAVSQKGNKYKACYFSLFGIPFQMAFGRDRSNNRVIIERVLDGNYKICGSSISINDRKKKMFLYLTIDIPETNIKLEDKALTAYLGFEVPIVVKLPNKKTENIGNKDEFLHRRKQIQAALRRLQIDSRYNNGGHGRGKKLQAIDRYKEKEKNYVKTKLHLYSLLLVRLAIQFKCNTIRIENFNEVRDEAKMVIEPLLRNWSYHGLTEFIKYKAAKYGIIVEIPEKENEKKVKKTDEDKEEAYSNEKHIELLKKQNPELSEEEITELYNQILWGE